MRALLFIVLCACSSSSPPAGKAAPSVPAEASAPAAPASAGDVDLIRTADRAQIRWMMSGEAADRTGPELAQLLDALVVSEQEPGGGKNIAVISFFKADALLRNIWVLPDGEWGFEGGETRGLSPALADLIER